jgi:hypothetical protein
MTTALIVIIVVLLIAVAVFVGVMMYKKDACSKQDGKSSNVASYVFSFPFTCSANTCVSGFTLDSASGKCVAAAPTTCGSGLVMDLTGKCSNAWTDNVGLGGLGGTAYTTNQTLDTCQGLCMNMADCDVAYFNKAMKKCVLFPIQPNATSPCLHPDGNELFFQKPGGKVPPRQC